MSIPLSDQHEVITCTVKGKRCTAIDCKRIKWLYDAHSEAEAVLVSEAINDRGYVLKKWWREA